MIKRHECTVTRVLSAQNENGMCADDNGEVSGAYANNNGVRTGLEWDVRKRQVRCAHTVHVVCANGWCWRTH